MIIAIDTKVSPLITQYSPEKLRPGMYTKVINHVIARIKKEEKTIYPHPTMYLP